MRKFFAVFMLLGVASLTYAQDVLNTQEVSADAGNTIINSATADNSEEWGLTEKEWLRYQQLMRGPNGHWYPHLTPVQVLGLNALTGEEQRHFAEMAAKAEHDKLARELAFDRAVHQALQRLYSQEPVIRPFDLSPYNTVQPKAYKRVELQPGDHLILFVDSRQGLDYIALPKLIAAIKQAPKTVLDIFCVGNVEDKAIQSWAKLNHIPQELVAGGRITLNHDRGRLRTLAGHASLPYVLLLRDGIAKPISPGSLA